MDNDLDINTIKLFCVGCFVLQFAGKGFDIFTISA